MTSRPTAPQQAPLQQAPLQFPHRSIGTHDTRRRVLVIADDVGVREALQVVTQLEGCAAQGIEHGAEAERVISDWAPHAILVELPAASLEPIHLLPTYRHVAAPRTPIILITAAPPSADALLALGVVGVLPKPFNVGELLDLLQEHVACS